MSENELLEALLTGMPYFGPAMRAMQGPPLRHGYFKPVVEVIAKSKKWGPLRVLEIGSWAGASAITWAEAIKKLGRRGRVTCVDLWQPYFDLTVEQEPHYKEMSEAAKESKIFNLFLHNIRAAQVSNMIDYLIGRASDVLPKLPAEKFDIVYIDGSHLYEDVQSDIRNAKRLIREGGIICGDDLEAQRGGLNEREQRVAVELNKDYVYSRKVEKYYHPGVTEAVALEFGEVSSWEGVWATRKIGLQWAGVEVDVRAIEIPHHIKRAVQTLEACNVGPAEIVDATDGFNLVKFKGRFLAVAKQLGPTELFGERLGERELAPLLFSGESLEEVRRKALAFEKETTVPIVELVEEVGRYNVIKAGESFIAVAKELGPVNLLRERLGERDLPPILFVAHSIEEARSMVSKF